MSLTIPNTAVDATHNARPRRMRRPGAPAAFAICVAVSLAFAIATVASLTAVRSIYERIRAIASSVGSSVRRGPTHPRAARTLIAVSDDVSPVSRTAMMTPKMAARSGSRLSLTIAVSAESNVGQSSFASRAYAATWTSAEPRPTPGYRLSESRVFPSGSASKRSQLLVALPADSGGASQALREIRVPASE